jgi:hypothetical protein
MEVFNLASQKAVTDISNAVSMRIGRRLIASEIMSIIGFIKNFDYQRINRLKPADAINLIANEYVDKSNIAMQTNNDTPAFQNQLISGDFNNSKFNLRANIEQATESDIYLKAINKLTGNKTLIELINESNKLFLTYGSVNLNTHRVSLDSRNRLLEGDYFSSTTQTYRWALSTTFSPVTQGVAKIYYPIENLLQINVREFSLPIANINTDDLLQYRKVRVQIPELQEQSSFLEIRPFLTSTSNAIYNYHYEFDLINIIGNRAYLKPSIKNSIEMINILTKLDTISMVFRTPFNPVNLLPDRGNWNVIVFNPLFTEFELLTNVDHFLVTGDLVYLNVQQADTTPNQKIEVDLLNRVEGHTVIVISPTVIRVNSPSQFINPFAVEIYYAKRRIFMEIDIVSLRK